MQKNSTIPQTECNALENSIYMYLNCANVEIPVQEQ